LINLNLCSLECFYHLIFYQISFYYYPLNDFSLRYGLYWIMMQFCCLCNYFCYPCQIMNPLLLYGELHFIFDHSLKMVWCSIGLMIIFEDCKLNNLFNFSVFDYTECFFKISSLFFSWKMNYFFGYLAYLSLKHLWNFIAGCFG